MFGLAVFAVGAAEVPNALALPGDAEIACEPEANGMLCRYRLLPPGQAIQSVTATLDGAALAVSAPEPYPHPGSRSTILFLVDTGSEDQQQILAQKRQQIEKILAKAGPHHRFGLAAVDNELRLLELPVNDAGDIGHALKRLKPSGNATELYRTTLVAVRLLAKQPTDRKAIFLVSDGHAEDTAYFARDVIEAAREGGVVINSLGFAPSHDARAALQSLRRLSEETGGEFVSADDSGELPAAFMESPFRAVDNGGRFRIERPAAGRAAGSLEVLIATEDREYTSRQPVVFSMPPPPRQKTLAAQPRRQVTPLKHEEELSFIDFALLGGLLVLFGIVAYLLVKKIRPGSAVALKSSPRVAPVHVARTDVFGVLDFIQAPERSPIVLQGESFRVGRNADNDIRLEDSSVSRHHAQIHRGPDGAYVVSDLNSLNGIYVNNRQVQSSQLKDGDKLEIGDVGMKFRLTSDPDAPSKPGERFDETMISRQH